MGRGDLSDDEWALLEPHLPKNRGRGGRCQCHRRVINGILFRQRTSLPWRDLPSRFGNWKTVHDRHRKWSADGRLEKVLRAIQAAADAEGRIDWSMVSVDSTSCRAHRAAGARSSPPRVPGQHRGPDRHRLDEAPGRSRGGLTCKLHLAGEGGRRPLAFIITPGQWGDAPQMIPVFEQIRVPRPGSRHPPLALTTSAETSPIRPAATAVTCGDARSSTPFRRGGTSAPTADVEVVRVADRPASIGRSTAVATKWSE